MLELDKNMDYSVRNDNFCWVGYFDLLGTSQLIDSGKMRQVLYTYTKALSDLGVLNKRRTDISHAWFSDTFLIYSIDASRELFAAIEKVCRLFMTALIGRNIPVIGSISYGRFYSDKANSLYLGPALVEAHKWGENQDWIGLLLCPSCITRLEELSQSAKDYKHYVEFTRPPFMKSLPDDSCRCAACILGNWEKEGNSDSSALLGNLRRMRDEQKDETIIRKYRRTIDFIERHQTRLHES